MLKGLVKILLLGIALIAVTLIPGNAKLVFGYGSSSNSNSGSLNSTTGAPTCDKQQPDKVTLYEPNHPLLPKAANPKDVRLNWLKANRSTKYTLAFGLSSGNYIYGLPDIGNTDNFTVSYLAPGTTYYFVVRGVNDCMPGPWSMEWAVKAGGETGTFTSLDTNAPSVIIPPNIPVASPAAEIVAPSVTTVQQPTQAPVQPTVQPTAQSQQPTQAPVQPTVQQQQTGAYTPPQPTPTPQPGFFQRLWNGFLGLFGKK